jgi:uncharacterized phage-like protein YoqJ
MNVNDFRTVAMFTGHRYIEIQNINSKVKEISLSLIEKGVNQFLVGGALGFDCVAGEEIIRIRQDKPEIMLTVVLPCNFCLFTLKWNERQRTRINALLQRAGEVITLQKDFTPDCYKKRNQYLVNNSRYCVCCYNPNNFKSGTGQTVRMAEKRGLEIINLFH